MSLLLNGPDTEPDVEAKTVAGHGLVFISIPGTAIQIGLEDFLAMSEYVLTNTNLMGDDDPRLAFIKKVSELRPGKGYLEMRGGREIPTMRLVPSK